MQTILICYDGSNEAERAVDAAACLFGSRPAVVLNVEPAMTFAEGIAASASPVPGSALEDLNWAEALRLAEAGATRARHAGLDAKAQATIAPTAWQGIVDVADELDASVIVVGTRGRGGLHDVAHGSVSHDLTRHARRPVLVVPPPTTKSSA